MSKTNNRKLRYIQSISDMNDFVEKNNKLLRFNLKYYRPVDNNGDSFEGWQKDQILDDLNNKLKDFSRKTKEELLRDGTLELYGGYPDNSQFEKPKDIDGEYVVWSRLRITGRRRLIGFFMKNNSNTEDVFYVVFLDKEHVFAPSKKRHT